jgi:hypothetical protein
MLGKQSTCRYEYTIRKEKYFHFDPFCTQLMSTLAGMMKQGCILVEMARIKNVYGRVVCI